MSNNTTRKRTLETGLSAIDINTQETVAVTDEASNASENKQGSNEGLNTGLLMGPVGKPAKTGTVRTPSVRLGALAAEIHISIADHCANQDLRALRLVCRSLSKDTTDVFARRFFSELDCKIVLSDSMGPTARLQAISNVPEFCRQVKRFSIYADSSYNSLSSGEAAGSGDWRSSHSHSAFVLLRKPMQPEAFASMRTMTGVASKLSVTHWVCQTIASIRCVSASMTMQ